MLGNATKDRLRRMLPPPMASTITSLRGVGRLVTSDYKKHLHDAAFMDVWREAKHNTLVDVLRLHELWSLVGQSAKLDAGAILEVGVWRGGSALILARAMERNGIKDTLYLADTFAGVVKAGVNDKAYVGGEHADTSEDHVAALMKRHGIARFELLRGMFPEDTADRVTGPLRMVHVDVDVYQGAKDIVEWAYPRLVPLGIVVFDDYGFKSTVGVTKLGEEYEKDPRFMFVHNWNGHAVLFKRPA